MLSSSCARTSFSLLSLRSLTIPADSIARRRASRFLVSQRGAHEYLAYGAAAHPTAKHYDIVVLVVASTHA
jgi:hypothetical protein